MRLKIILLLTTCLSARVALAADTQPYTVSIESTGNKSLDSALKASSQLESLRKSAPAGLFAIVGRAQSDIDRLDTVLDSFGYYRREVTITIAGKALDDPTLSSSLTEMPSSSTAEVLIKINPGPLFHLRKVTLEGDVSNPARAAFALQSGAPAVAGDVLAAGQRLQDAMQNEGHAYAKVEEPIAFEDLHEPVLDVDYKAEPGPVYHLGEIRFQGLKRVHEAFLRRRLKIHTGQQFSASNIEHARSDLLSLDVFSGITVRLPKQEEVIDGQIPVTFQVKERKRHAVALTAAYSSDLGASGGATWTDRNAFGNGERLSFGANLINAGGTNSTQLGYQITAQLIKPNFIRTDQSLEYDAGVLKQSLDSYDQTEETVGVALNRTLSARWKVSVGVTLADERIVQQVGFPSLYPPQPPAPAPEQFVITPVTHYYTLLALPITLKYDTTGLTNLLDDPLHGVRVTGSATPTESFNSSESYSLATGQTTTEHFSTTAPRATFVILQGGFSTYLDLAQFDWTKAGRSVFAIRALAARAIGAGEFGLPPDQRFYGGGSATVRGYAYQSVGPTLAHTTTPAGGTELAAGGIEFRQRLFTNFGTVVFVDSGAVTDQTGLFEGSLHAFSQKLYTGAGTGLRYYTPIGPVRVDLAFPLRHLAGGSSFEVYVGLGQSF